MPSKKTAPFTKRADPSEKEAAPIRRAVEAGEMSMTAAAKALGCSYGWLKTYTERMGWRAAAKTVAVKAGNRPAKTAKVAPRKATAKQAPRAPLRITPAPADDEDPPGQGDIMDRLARRALRLMDILERKLDEETLAEDHMKMMAQLIKMLADFKRNAIQPGENDVSKDARRHDDNPAPETPEDMARLRAELAATIADVVASHAAASGAGGDAGEG